MNIMASNGPDRAMVRIRNHRSQEAVRWYALTFPTIIGGRDNICLSKGLDAELSRRRRCGGPLFECFAPLYTEAREVGGKVVSTRRPPLYNYVFIRAPKNEIFRLKRIMPLYNLLPQVSTGEHSYLPYLSDHEMETLRWIAGSYSNGLPVYVPDSDRLLKGDRVRITSGSFMGMEVEATVQPGGGRKGAMVRILDRVRVPLLKVRQGEYELIELNTKGKHAYTHLGSDRLSEGIYKILGYYYLSDKLGEEDESLAHEVPKGYASLHVETGVVRCKIYSLLSPAYKLLAQEEEFERLHFTPCNMPLLVRAANSRILLLVMLYGRTGGSLYYHIAHELIDP